MRVIQEIDEDDVIQTRLILFNPFLKNNLVLVNNNHVVYYGEGSDEIAEAYQEFTNHINEEEEKEKRTLVLKKNGNVMFGNFKKEKVDNLIEEETLTQKE